MNFRPLSECSECSECSNKLEKEGTLFLEFKISTILDANSGDEPPKKRHKSDSGNTRSVGPSNYEKSMWQGLGAYLCAVLLVTHSNPISLLLTSVSTSENGDIFFYSTKHQKVVSCPVSSEMQLGIIAEYKKNGNITNIIDALGVHPAQGKGQASFLTRSVLSFVIFFLDILVCTVSLFFFFINFLITICCFNLYFDRI